MLTNRKRSSKIVLSKTTLVVMRHVEERLNSEWTHVDIVVEPEEIVYRWRNGEMHKDEVIGRERKFILTGIINGEKKEAQVTMGSGEKYRTSKGEMVIANWTINSV